MDQLLAAAHGMAPGDSGHYRRDGQHPEHERVE
jgi:hypothetical protein